MKIIQRQRQKQSSILVRWAVYQCKNGHEMTLSIMPRVIEVSDPTEGVLGSLWPVLLAAVFDYIMKFSIVWYPKGQPHNMGRYQFPLLHVVFMLRCWKMWFFPEIRFGSRKLAMFWKLFSTLVSGKKLSCTHDERSELSSIQFDKRKSFKAEIECKRIKTKKICRTISSSGNL